MAGWGSLFGDIGRITGGLLESLLGSSDGTSRDLSEHAGRFEFNLYRDDNGQYEIIAQNLGTEPAVLCLSLCGMDENGQAPTTILHLFPRKGDSRNIAPDLSTYADGLLTVNDATAYDTYGEPRGGDRVVIAAIRGLSFGALWTITGGFKVWISQKKNPDGSGWTYEAGVRATNKFNFVDLMATGTDGQTASVRLESPKSVGDEVTSPFPNGTYFGSEFTSSLSIAEVTVDLPLESLELMAGDRSRQAG